MNKTMAINCITNGQWGQTFCVGAIVYEGDEEIDRIMLRCHLQRDIDNDTKTLLPFLDKIEVDCEDYVELLDKFSNFYKTQSCKHIVTFKGYIAEVKFLRDAAGYGFIDIEDMPEIFRDVNEGMYQIGYEEPTLIGFTHSHFVDVENLTQGGTKGPLWACKAIYRIYEKLNSMR